MRKRVAELDKHPVLSEVPQVQRPVWVQLPICGRDMGVWGPEHISAYVTLYCQRVRATELLQNYTDPYIKSISASALLPRPLDLMGA